MSGNQSSQPQLRASYSDTTSPYIQEFTLPTPQAIPGPIAVAPNGTVWFAETNAGSLAKFSFSKGFAEFPFKKNSSNYILPGSATKAINSVATDPKGNVWFTFASANAFGYFNTTSQTFTYYNLTRLNNRSNNFPFGITVDSNEIAWVAETGTSRIGRLDPANGSFREYQLPQPNASPLEIFIDNSQNLWITSYWYVNGNNPHSGRTLTRFDPARQEIVQEYNLSDTGIFTPVGVVVDENGRAWIGDHAGSWLGEVNTITRVVKLHRTSLPPLNPNPKNLTDRVFDASITLVNDVVLGIDGTPWFIEHIGARIGHYIPASDTLIEYNIPTLTPITLWLAADRTGGIWFTEEYGNKLGYLNTHSATPPFSVSSPSSVNAQVTTCGSNLVISIRNLSPNSINIAAGVENTLSFSGPITDVTISGGASMQVTVEMSSSSSLLPGNYSSARFADLTPVIKVTDGNINYPITVFADVTRTTICPGVLLYAGAGSILAFAGISAMLLYNKKKHHEDSLSQT